MIALTAVLIGAAITLLSTFGLEAWRNSQRKHDAREEADHALRQAVRLVLVELDEIDTAMREAARVGAYWTDRMAGRELPTGTGARAFISSMARSGALHSRRCRQQPR